jgi:hypothetical protein
MAAMMQQSPRPCCAARGARRDAYLRHCSAQSEDLRLIFAAPARFIRADQVFTSDTARES